MKNQAIQKEGSIQYGDISINFAIEPRLSDTPKVLIKVHPDCRVVALAPSMASHEEIIEAVRKRARWVYRQMKYFEAQYENILPRNYVSGESHFYLGRRHLLKVKEDTKCTPEVKLLRGVLEVKTKITKPEKTKELLFEWYRERAKEVFDRRLDQVMPQTLWIKEKPSIRLLYPKR